MSPKYAFVQSASYILPKFLEKNAKFLFNIFGLMIPIFKIHTFELDSIRKDFAYAMCTLGIEIFMCFYIIILIYILIQETHSTPFFQ